MKKYNKFDRVIEEYKKTLTGTRKLVKEENAISDQLTIGGIKVGTPFRLKPSFFTQSEAIQEMDQVQIEALKEANARQYAKCQHYFKIKEASGATVGANVKSANNQNRSNIEYTAISAAEKDNPILKFIFPKSDIKHIDIQSTSEDLQKSGGLMPVLGVLNKYEQTPVYMKPEVVDDKMFKGLNNSPTDRSLKQS